ncbi:MAG: (deoxy)nucleoside triphosphate pyrophosphohydrolase [Treponema sp.]|jgi:8-oxo-dGTP diphosphatase|nr:(deoxy)nucleoside triphosphate pyrophosphohydrolase [Treponema sp.]
MLQSVAGIALRNGRLFIARRKAGGDLGGKWEFPGGKVEADESDEDAVRREYREEFGVSVRTGPLVGSACFEHRGIPRTLNAYRIYFSAPKFKLQEHSEWRWASLEEIEGLDFAGSDRKLLPALKQYLTIKPAPAAKEG